MKNWALSVIAIAVVIFWGWYSGVDYLVRGHDQAFWVAGALSASIWLYLRRKLAVGELLSQFSLRLNRIRWTAAVFVFVLADGWYAGVNFGVRGAGAAELLMLATAFAGLTWFCPVWVPVELGTTRLGESRLHKT
ncbi:hypothetical protein WK73_15110 [Burkholderia ubonensis]|uniref:hypothetical protein n=1 Tax=Burkholderia ubonensis TaxID=101571 RepID=UPI00075C865D|nr:hypothetical protein [Burkholderia ubonensis]KVU74711.1 hypothetical protein WK73_15110 [Burkholderia ubonensis]